MTTRRPFLSDSLPMDEWQRRRNLDAGGANSFRRLALPTDDMPMGDWQLARNLQVQGGTRSDAPGEGPFGGAADNARLRLAAAPTPRSERQWEVEAAQASRGKSDPLAAAAAPAAARSSTPQARVQRTKGDAARDLGAGKLLDRIALGEAPDRPVSYDTTYGYGAFVPKTSKALSTMTLDEVAALQRDMLSRQTGKLKSSAVGKYQIKRSTFDEVRKTLGLNGSDLFDAETQDRMARELLDRRGYGDFLAGKRDLKSFQGELAKEWASVALPGSGLSYHHQPVGTNTSQMQAALDEARAEGQHLITSFNVDPYERGWR